MKNLIKHKSYILFLLPIMAMVFFIGTMNAQRMVKNNKQTTSKTQRLNNVDNNGDSFVCQNNYQNANCALNRSAVGNSRLGMNRNNANGVETQRGNRTGQGVKQGNGKNRGNGICPNGNQCPRYNSNTNTRGQNKP